MIGTVGANRLQIKAADMSISPPDSSSDESRRSNACAALDADDFARVVEAAELYVSSRSALMSFVSILGNLVHHGLRRLPEEWRNDIVNKISETLDFALRVSIARMDDRPGRKSSGGRYIAIAVATGAGGGAFGLPSVLAELPITTGLILRSIADIGRSCGERLDDPEFRATCIEVFAYGTPLDEEDEEIAFVLARMGAIESASKISELVGRIAVRYAATLAPKIAAMSVPVTGAVLGAGVNWAYMNFYQSVARVLFMLLPIERKHDPAQVRSCFSSLVRELRNKRGARAHASRAGVSKGRGASG